MEDIWVDFLILFQTLSWIDWIDLLLVTVVFFGLITALQRAQATFIVRGLALIGLLLLPIAFLLPLPTFSLLVRGIMLFMIIAIPVIFQRELRHLLENLGRRIGLTPFARRETESLVQPLMRAIHQMASQRIGVLIALEGEMDLEELAGTGVAVDGRVSSELLTAIFFGKNPLHDGATIIRGQTVVAAACILPLSQREIHDPRHIGTRHRAAVGLSEQSDALVLVVSEETGDISIAEEGKLQKLEGVALVVNGEPASGYWISGLTAQPATIIVSGAEDVLSQLGGAVPTQPINISGAAGDVRIDIPLDIPAEVSVRTPEGEPIKSIKAMVRVTARRGNLTVEQPVELQLSPLLFLSMSIRSRLNFC